MKMKLSLLAAIVALSFAAPALATEQPDENPCKEVADLAATIQLSRQVGVTLDEVLELIEQLDMPQWRKEALRIYETPRFNGRDYQDNAVEETRTKYRIACEKERSE